ncbi:hypothetical protein LguiB_029506 [Lonicera macranthoides]
MTIGIMEVKVECARGLKNTEILDGGIDPYVLVQYRSQEHKSSIARGQGRAPVWNEKFTFRADIYLKELLALGVENGRAEIHTQKYSIVDCNQTYCGEIKVGITFTPKINWSICSASLIPTRGLLCLRHDYPSTNGARELCSGADQKPEFQRMWVFNLEVYLRATYYRVQRTELFQRVPNFLANHCIIKDLLMQPSDEKQKRVDLQDEVEKLQTELDGEIKLNMVLQCAMEGPVNSCPCLSSFLPLKVQVLLAELAMVEEEITWLERKVDEVKLSLYQEKKQNKEWKLAQLKDPQQQPKQRRHKQLPSRHGTRTELKDCELFSRSQNYDEFKSYRVIRERRASVGSSIDIQSMSSLRASDDLDENPRYHRRNQNPSHVDTEISIEKPNTLSEELIKCLIGIYLKLNQPPMDRIGSSMIPKHTLSCMNSKGFISKNSFNCICNVPASSRDDTTSNIDPYGILLDIDGINRDVGPYKKFIQITRSSLDMSHVSECFLAMGKLRLNFLDVQAEVSVLDQHLQCLHNACTVRHLKPHGTKGSPFAKVASVAFLQHGLPSSQEKLLALMNKGPADEKEMLLRHAYGLGYPEPNVTFALCRGSWSSPALRVYTPDEIVDELGRARVEYLEASVGVTSKKKIMVPKLLQWHMRDFADDIESLLEWIYSQLPQYGSQKRLIMECLNGETKSPLAKIVEIQPYASEFRYLMPLRAK